MSRCENSSEGSDLSNLSYEEWEVRVSQQNRQLDQIMSELLIKDHHPRARRYCDRERELGEKRLMEDYFVDNPTYDQATFQNRF
jgi:hypothetical protein